MISPASTICIPQLMIVDFLLCVCEFNMLATNQVIIFKYLQLFNS